MTDNNASEPNVINDNKHLIEPNGRDDSFDAEFSLLQSTLIELKENENKPEKCSIESNCSKANVRLNLMSVVETKGSEEITNSGKTGNSDFCSRILDLDGNNESFHFSNVSSRSEILGLHISSTSKHFKSTDEPNILTCGPLSRLETPAITFNSKLSCSTYLGSDKNVYSDCYSDITENIVDSLLVNNSDHIIRPNDIIVSKCDSSSNKYRPNHSKYISVQNSGFAIESIIDNYLDINTDKIGCGLKTAVSRNISAIAMDSLNPESLNQECSHISNTDSRLIREAEVIDLTETDELEASVTLCDFNTPSRPSVIPKLEETDYFVLNKENEKPKLLDKDLNNSEYDNLEVLKFSNKPDIKTSHISTQSKSDETLNNKPEVNLTDIIKDEIVENSNQNFDAGDLKQKIFCSTPVASKETFTRQRLQSDANTDFGQMSPLDMIHIKKRMNLKRKSFDLECIQEVNEDSSGACIEKKIKLGESLFINPSAKASYDQNIRVSGFEVPANSLLKKWQPSGFSKNSSLSYFILDEYDESTLEDGIKPSQDLAEPLAIKPCQDVAEPLVTKPSQVVAEPLATDDFEVACKSLTEELIKSSFNIESLETCHSKDQFENKLDAEKFDEVLQESAFLNECDEKRLLLFKPKEETEQAKTDTKLFLKKINNLITEADNLIKESHNTNSEDNTVFKAENLDSENNISAEASSSAGTSSIENVSIKTSTVPLSIEVVQSETSKTNEVEFSDINNTKRSDQRLDPKTMSILYADGKDMTMDEEDFLLEEDLNVKKKPYVFFEFVSNDPKENEDNYNPEWQKLGRLTSDEERFKAVRDRWRSLVPPDPNRDLTFRQWREKNRKPPLNLPSLNNNHQIYNDNEKTQLCTAVFQRKINQIYQEFYVRQEKILQKHKMNVKEQEHSQDKEQTRLLMRGASSMDIEILREHHMEERQELINRHDQEIQRFKNIADGKAKIFRDASEEVMLFQKFYKGVGASDEVCLYLTDIQVQELVETEEMLEQYTSFYN